MEVDMTRVISCVLLFAACAPQTDAPADWLDEPTADADSEAVARAEAEDEIALGLEELDVALADEAWSVIDTHDAVAEATEIAATRGCHVAGIIGGVWSDEHQVFRARVKRLGPGGADVRAAWQRIGPEGGVWAGRWRGWGGEVNGNLGGLYSDDHRLAGVWSLDGDAEGVVHGRWARINERGGVLIGVWANCHAPRPPV
jgi:hypothetical protein